MHGRGTITHQALDDWIAMITYLTLVGIYLAVLVIKSCAMSGETCKAYGTPVERKVGTF